MKQYETSDRRGRISTYAYLMQMRREKGGKKERLETEVRKMKGSCAGATEGGTYGL